MPTSSRAPSSPDSTGVGVISNGSRSIRTTVAGALPAAAEERFAALGGRRGDAMVLDDNDAAHHAWSAAGYAPEPRWSRWVKAL